MKTSISIAISLLAIFGATSIAAEVAVDDELIARAVLPLPESLRSDAGVYTYDPDSGARIALREGTNAVECKIRDENEHTWCYPKSTAARRDYSAKLAASGLEGDELRAAEAAAEEAGTIQPYPPGAMLYRLDESEGGIKLLWVVMLPNLVAADLGISTAGRFQSAVSGKGTPWMMREGTSTAHLMIPVNGTDLSNPGGAEAPLDPDTYHPYIRATLPLPADLRRETTVVSYDKESGERETLRPGTNTLVCVARNTETGLTRCMHKENLAELDLRMKLRAEGKKTNKEIETAVMAAVGSGKLPPRRFGGLAYRYNEGDDGLKLMWVLRLPGVTGKETGLPTVADRDSLKMGKGTPWLRQQGTPRAHLMIPINGTELSNFH
jgi:hypothetical protein